MLKNHDLALFILRVSVGAIFIAHGWAKFGNMGMTINFFGSLGLPSVLAYAVATIELVGGLALVLGVWTNIAAMLIAIVMIGAILSVKIGSGHFIGAKGFELELALFAAALATAIIGPGKYVAMKMKR